MTTPLQTAKVRCALFRNRGRPRGLCEMKTVARTNGVSASPTERPRVLRRVGEKGRLGKRGSRRKSAGRPRLAVRTTQLLVHSSSAGSTDVDTDTESSQSSRPSSPPTSRADHVPSIATTPAAVVAEEMHRNPRAGELVALDCEMVSTRHGSALAQCSIVAYGGETLFHAYIRPAEPITDYRTRWSGILPHHMKRAMPHETAVARIRKILRGKVIIGHDLTHDLSAIGISPPKHETRDTAYFKPLRSLAGLDLNHNPSLKNLALRLLGRVIQVGSHNSLEDALAALGVYRKHECLWEKYLVEQEWDRAVWLQDQFWPKDIIPH